MVPSWKVWPCGSLENKAVSKSLQDSLSPTLLTFLCCCCSPCQESHSVHCFEASWHKGFRIAQRQAPHKKLDYTWNNLPQGAMGQGSKTRRRLAVLTVFTANVTFPHVSSQTCFLLNKSLLLSEALSWYWVLSLTFHLMAPEHCLSPSNHLGERGHLPSDFPFSLHSFSPLASGPLWAAGGRAGLGPPLERFCPALNQAQM